MKKSIKLLFACFSLLLLFCFAACKKESNSKPDYGTGLKFDKKRYDKVPEKAQLLKRSYENLPSKVVLTDFTPPVADQGRFGTCVAWASTYAGMTTAEAASARIVNKNEIEEMAFSPYYLYRSCNPHQIKASEVKGMYPEDALDWLKNYGVPRRSHSEFYASYETFDIKEYDKADLFKIENYSSLGSSIDFSYYQTDNNDAQRVIRNIKKSISEKKPVLGAFRVSNDFVNQFWKEDYIPKNLDKDLENLENLSGHAMLIVGYDDKRYYDSDNDEYSGAFLLQNSWGSDWGSDGYIWVNYELAYCFLMGAYEISNKIIKIPYKETVIDIEEEEEEEEYNDNTDWWDDYDDNWWWSYDDDDWWWNSNDDSENDWWSWDDKKDDKKDPKKIPVIPEPDVKPEPKPTPKPEPKPAPEPEKKYCIFEGEFTLPIYNDDGEIQVQLKDKFYETKQSYDSFTRFQLYMTNKKPCYVYAFAADDSLEKPNKLFPPDGVNALLDYHENTVVYPSEDTCMRLDSREGTDYLVVLYSLNELKLEDIMTAYQKEIKRNPLDVYGALVNACGQNKVVAAENQTFGKNQISFNAQVPASSKASIMPILIKIKHE